MKKAFLGIFVLLFLFACNEKEKTVKEKKEQQDNSQFVSQEFGYKIKIPELWMRLDSGNDTQEVIKKLMGDFYQESINYEAVYTMSEKSEPDYPFMVLYGKKSVLPKSMEEISKMAGAEFLIDSGKSISENILQFASDSVNIMVIDKERGMMYISNKLELPGNGKVKLFITMCFGSNRLVSLACYYSEDKSNKGINEYAKAVESFYWGKGMGYVGK